MVIFVLFKCELGAAYSVAHRLTNDIPETVEVFSTSGEYDLLAKFRIPEGDDLGRFVTSKVQSVSGIKDTYTLVTFSVFST